MTTLDPQLLAAYADGELDDHVAAGVRAAIDADPELAALVMQHRQLRNRVRAASRGVLDEAIPPRLMQALEAKPPASPIASTIDLSAQRELRSATQRLPARPMPSTWARWGGMAASLVIGLSIGLMLQFDKAATPFETSASGLVARGAIAEALSNRLASEAAPASTVRLQISFLDRTGRHCRTFTTASLAGLACRDGDDWAVQTLLQAERTGGATLMRQAGSPLPDELLDMVDQRMQGDALDAAAERAARQRNWQR